MIRPSNPSQISKEVDSNRGLQPEGGSILPADGVICATPWRRFFYG